MNTTPNSGGGRVARPSVPFQLIYETTNGGYPLETAQVSVSRDAVDWTVIGTANNLTDPGSSTHPTTLQVDRCIGYVKIVDTTNPGDHDPTADAFDVNAVCASYNCDEETAWGGCIDKDGEGFEGKNWATYFTYEVQ